MPNPASPDVQFSLHSHFADQAEKFVDIFQKTTLGKFISALTEEDKEMLFQRYITDFIVLSIGVSSVEELQVSELGTPWVQWRAGRPGPCPVSARPLQPRSCSDTD